MSLRNIVDLKNQLERNAVENNLESQKVHTNALEDCDCVRIDKEIVDLVESDAHWPMEDNACGPMRSGDEIEDAIQRWIGHLNDVGYYEEDAERAVFDALAALVENNIIPDCPDYDMPLPVKKAWISTFDEKIQVKLVQLGIDLQG
jgi:hypothetical protein